MQDRIPSMGAIMAFLSAAETLSFRIASERLNITVSAVSYRIKNLEREIGAPLFDRGATSVKLTAAGVAYRARIQPAIDEIERATKALRDDVTSPSVQIASFQLFHENWLGPRIQSFIRKHPNAEIRLTTLRRDRISFPDITIRIKRPADIRKEDVKLFDWDMAPVCLPELVEQYGISQPTDFLRIPLISASAAPDVWEPWLVSAGVDPELPYTRMIADSPALTTELAATGAGAVMMARFQTEYASSRGLVRPFPIFCRFPGGVFINRAAGQERPMVAAFREWLMAEVTATSA